MLSVSNIINYFNNLVKSVYITIDTCSEITNNEMLIASQLFKNLENYIISDEFLDETILKITNDNCKEYFKFKNENSSDDESMETETINKERNSVSFKSMEKAVNMRKIHPKWSFKTY